MTRSLATQLEHLIASGEPVILVTITEVKGSSPRSVGTRMAVTGIKFFGSIGGGHLEYMAIHHARRMISAGKVEDDMELALGPAVGQCCGGRISLRFVLPDGDAVAAVAADEAKAAEAAPRVALFGAGHVGLALATALAPLPLRLLWADDRADAFPPEIDDNIEVATGDWSDVMALDRSFAAVLVMTYDHGLDFEITEAALGRVDCAYVGLIGSSTKRRRFESWYLGRGGEQSALDRLICPIGDFGVGDKRPEVIAAFTAAEIMQKVFPA